MTTDVDGTGGAASELTISRNLFPLVSVNQAKELSIESVALYSVPAEDALDETFPQSLKINLPDQSPVTWGGNVSIANLSGKTFTANVSVSSKGENDNWKMSVSDTTAFKQNVDDILMFFMYRKVANSQ
jgi:hypothetical protein